MALYSSVIKKVSGDVDGVNKIFTTDSVFVAGTFRLIVNGQVYESDEDEYGWVEVDSETIETNEAPLAGDIVQAFYQDGSESASSVIGVVGSPFDPSGALP